MEPKKPRNPKYPYHRPKPNPYIQKRGRQKLKPLVGGIRTEEELRAYIKCSRFHEFGGRVELSDKVRIFKHLVEYVIAYIMRKRIEDPFKVLNHTVVTVMARENKKHHFMDQELERLSHLAVIWIHDFFKMFSFTKYKPISPARTGYAKSSHTSFALEISGAFKNNDTETIHIVDFSPYGSEHAIINDPVAHLKLQLFRDLVNLAPEHMVRPAAVYHGFHISDSDYLTYASLSSKDLELGYMDRFILETKLMEKGHSYPLVPCPYSCIYKNICKPGGK